MTLPTAERALGIVLLGCDDDQAPGGCWALRRLAGQPLLRHAVTALGASGRVGRVLVPAPPQLLAPISDALAGCFADRQDCDVRLVPVDGLAPTLPALLRAPDADGAAVVVVHDALHPLTSAQLVAAVVDRLTCSDGAVGAVAVRAVTDTLKWVGPGGVITGTADRDGFRVICSPHAYRPGALRALLAQSDPVALAGGGLGALCGPAGRLGDLLTVSAPQEVFRVADADDLELAEAVLGAVQGIR